MHSAPLAPATRSTRHRNERTVNASFAARKVRKVIKSTSCLVAAVGCKYRTRTPGIQVSYCGEKKRDYITVSFITHLLSQNDIAML